MKRIITCSDGTWNKPNSKYQGKPVRTNVQKIFDYILKREAISDRPYGRKVAIPRSEVLLKCWSSVGSPACILT